jgi:hypothetical protein
LLVDLANGNRFLEKGQAVPHQKVTPLPVFRTFKPGIMFFSRPFKIR